MSDELLLKIAMKHFHTIKTLKTQNSDSLDFHDVAVWAIKASLQEAFLAGQEFESANWQLSI